MSQQKGTVVCNGKEYALIKMTCDECGESDYLGDDPYCYTDYEKSMKDPDNDLCPKCVTAQLRGLWEEQIRWR